MSADNGSYVVRTPAVCHLGYEYRVGHAQAIENAEWPDLPLRNQYLRTAFGGSWVFGKQRRAMAVAQVIEEEVASWMNGWGTEYGVCLVPVDTAFPGATREHKQFGDGDGIYVLKSPSSYGYDFRVVYATAPVAEAVAVLNNRSSSLKDVQAAAECLSTAFGGRRSMVFSKRGRAMRVAHLMHDDIVSGGGSTANGVTLVEITHTL